MISYGFYKELAAPFDETLEKVTEELKKNGFGVITEIDLKEKFKEKLGLDFKKYVILGACNPSSAYKAIQAEEDIGLLLPCNVIVYEKGGATSVSVIKPTVAMSMVNKDDLRGLAQTVEDALKRTFDAL